MKTTFHFFNKSFLLLALLFSFVMVQAQDKKATTKALVDSKRYVFKAQIVLPSGMASRQVSGEGYDLRILTDSLISYLPYFGRIYVAPPPGDRGGFNFTSTEFEYISKKTKKGGWEILIRPKDVGDIREFILNISEKGYANLRAISNNRQPISYNGLITSLK